MGTSAQLPTQQFGTQPITSQQQPSPATEMGSSFRSVGQLGHSDIGGQAGQSSLPIK